MGFGYIIFKLKEVLFQNLWETKEMELNIFYQETCHKRFRVHHTPRRHSWDRHLENEVTPVCTSSNSSSEMPHKRTLLWKSSGELSSPIEKYRLRNRRWKLLEFQASNENRYLTISDVRRKEIFRCRAATWNTKLSLKKGRQCEAQFTGQQPSIHWNW